MRACWRKVPPRHSELSANVSRTALVNRGLTSVEDAKAHQSREASEMQEEMELMMDPRASEQNSNSICFLTKEKIHLSFLILLFQTMVRIILNKMQQRKKFTIKELIKRSGMVSNCDDWR